MLPFIIEGLDPDVLTRIMTYLSIPDRLECRQVCRELCAQCPSPWRLAGDVLEAVNAFDVCEGCSAKLSFAAGPERPGDPCFNKLRLAAQECACAEKGYAKGWAWRGDAEEAALDASDAGSAFSRSDPRRKPAYAVLMRSVSARSYATLGNWAATGPWAPPSQRTPEAERLRQLLDFSRAAALRLHDHHEAEMSSSLKLEAGSLARWGGGSSETAIAAVYENLRTKEPCAYNLTFDLASLNVAADELFQSDPQECRWIYWFRNDDGEGVIRISEGSSLRNAREDYMEAVFDEAGEAGAGDLSASGATPCSDAHFEWLLARKGGGIAALACMFGDAICDELPLDPLARLRASWPLWCEDMRDIDGDFGDSSSSSTSDGDSGVA